MLPRLLQIPHCLVVDGKKNGLTYTQCFYCSSVTGLLADLSEEALAAKNAGNRAFFDTDDCAAICHYTEVGLHADA